jgi:hypothetical protein
MGNIRIKIGCWRRGVIGIMEFRAAVFPRSLAERSEIGERRNHPRTGLWHFVVKGRDLMGSPEEAPRETQVAAKCFVPTDVVMHAQRHSFRQGVRYRFKVWLPLTTMARSAMPSCVVDNRGHPACLRTPSRSAALLADKLNSIVHYHIVATIFFTAASS